MTGFSFAQIRVVSCHPPLRCIMQGMRGKRLISALRKKSERYHPLVHVLLGLACAFTVIHFIPGANILKLIAVGVLGNLIPDVDHLLYFFLYGRKSEYAKIFKSHLKLREFRMALRFIKDNHKNNTGVYSHNILSLMLSIFLAWYLGESRDRAGFYVFFMSWSTHYIFDMFEDVLFFKKLNTNWFMRFNRVKKELTQK